MKNPDTLQKQYRDYFDLITGRCEIEKSPLSSMVHFEDHDALGVYQTDYLNDQILNWSGTIKEIFPETCQHLEECGIRLNEFVPFFHQSPLPLQAEYDFFKIKLNRFKEFILENGNRLENSRREKLAGSVEKEYSDLMKAYLLFNPPQ